MSEQLNDDRKQKMHPNESRVTAAPGNKTQVRSTINDPGCEFCCLSRGLDNFRSRQMLSAMLVNARVLIATQLQLDSMRLA